MRPRARTTAAVREGLPDDHDHVRSPAQGTAPGPWAQPVRGGLRALLGQLRVAPRAWPAQAQRRGRPLPERPPRGGTGAVHGGGDLGEPTHLDHELTVLDLAARNAWLDRDYEQAATVRPPGGAGRGTRRPSRLLVELDPSAGQRADEAGSDTTSATTSSSSSASTRWRRESPELVVEALTLAARAARAAGRLPVALEHVTAARFRAEALPPSAPQRLSLRPGAWLPCLADLGRLPRLPGR